jgi:NADH-quinone oxidoreductase subunit L
LTGVFVTALYTFRMFFLVFHGEERIDDDARGHLHESPWVVTVPLILLAIPSFIIGWPTIIPLLFGDFFGDAIFVLGTNDVLAEMGGEFTGPGTFLLHGLLHPWALSLALAGAFTAWYLYIRKPEWPERISERLSAVHTVLLNKYYFDTFNEKVMAALTRGAGTLLWRVGDEMIIDGVMVNGSARLVGWASSVVRRAQTGYLYTYAFAMIIGLSAVVGWLLLWS